MNCHVYEFSYLLSSLSIVLSTNFELLCLEILRSLNCHVFVMYLNCHVYELSCLWIVMSMNCHIYELSCLWIVMSMNCHVFYVMFLCKLWKPNIVLPCNHFTKHNSGTKHTGKGNLIVFTFRFYHKSIINKKTIYL